MNPSGDEDKEKKKKRWNMIQEMLNTHFSEMSPRFRLSALVKAVIPLLLIELLWSLTKQRSTVMNWPQENQESSNTALILYIYIFC